MKKIMLLCTVGLIFACTDVGLATNASQTEKKALVCSDYDFYGVTEFVKTFDGTTIIIVNDCQELDINSVLTITPPVFIAPKPVTVEYNLNESFLPYKEKGQLKAKYHSWYLFNPVKLC